MTEKQSKFIALVREFELAKKSVETMREELLKAMGDLGQNSYTQDPDTLAVYKIVKPAGTFMFYRDIDYVRTALENERAGSLSKKEAEEQGFQLKK